VDYIGYELTRLEPDFAKIDQCWNEAMSLSGHSNLDLWMLHLQRSLEKYEDSCSDRDHAVAEYRQADIEVLDRARKARDLVVVNFENCLARVGFDFGAGGSQALFNIQIYIKTIYTPLHTIFFLCLKMS
jgi:hypothetical protein